METERSFVQVQAGCVWAADGTCDPTFDFLSHRFLLTASYFLSHAPNADDGLQLREGGEPAGLQQHHGTQETGRLGGIRETRRRLTGAWPVVHLEEKEGA